MAKKRKKTDQQSDDYEKEEISSKKQQQSIEKSKSHSERREEQAPIEQHENESDDDSGLIAAAGAWAEEQDQSIDSDHENDDKEQEKKNQKKKKKKKKKNENKTMADAGEATSSNDPKKPSSFSLHVTQLSFDATEWDIRQHFVENGGCLLRSVRLVYDKGLSGNKQFRGVAFVDCADEASYESALKTLHHSRLLDRRINVRPTLSKDELVNVVHDTQDKVRQKIRMFIEKKERKEAEQGSEKVEQNRKRKNPSSGSSKNQKDYKESGLTDETKTIKKPKRKKPPNHSNQEDKPGTSHEQMNKHDATETRATAKRSPQSPEPLKQAKKTPPSKKLLPAANPKSGKHNKLSKKERNRRAAIIMGRKRK